MIRTFTAAALLATVGLVGSAHGATIASFEFTSGSASSSDTETLTSVSDISLTGSTITGITYAGDELRVDGDQTPSNNRSVNPGANQFFTFSIDAPTGVTLSLDQIAFDWGYINSFGYNLQLRGSADSFASGLWAVDSAVQNSANTAVSTKTVNLSAIAGYQNVSNDTLEFRFYVADSSSSATRYAIFDNISVTGTATPEPGSLALLGLGGLLIARRRRD